MYAVLKTGGKQYKVSPGDIIVVEKLLGDAGAKVKLDQVMIVGEDGKEYRFRVISRDIYGNVELKEDFEHQGTARR